MIVVMWRNNIPPRPTKRDLRTQIMMGLAESGHKYRHGELSDMQLGSTVRRAIHNGIPLNRIAAILCVDETEVERLRTLKYVGGYDNVGFERNTNPTTAK